MRDPLIILSPPRSFSSVVSTMIGEHPQLYGFPELHILSGNTVEEIIRREAKRGNPGPPGLIRTLAQEHDGIQTSKTIMRAIAWFRARRHWPTKKLFDYLLDLISPQIGVEKSPETASKQQYLERSQAWFPKAYYLHLTRHPIAARRSIQEFYNQKTRRRSGQPERLKHLVDSLLVWYDMHKLIIDFTNTLPIGRVLRIKGEELLSNPDCYLPQITAWLNLRTDAQAIDAMKHPENSPYAYVGPYPARGGNDGKFMRSPCLRAGRVKEPSLAAFFAQEDWEWASDEFKAILREAELGFASAEEMVAEVSRLAHLMGYQ